MKCLNCKSELTDINNPCPSCNYKNDANYLKYIQDEKVLANLNEYRKENEVTDINETEYNNNVSNLNNNDNSVIDNEIYLEAYVGKNYQKIKKGGFSWCCLFLGEYYLLYKKMYPQVFSIYLARLISSLAMPLIWLYLISIDFPNKFDSDFYYLLVHEFLPSVLPFLVTVSIAIFFKENYLKEAKARVDKILEKSSEKTVEQKIDICKREGTTNIIWVIILVFILVWLETKIVSDLISGFIKSIF